jgi:hypothetical protein
VVLFGLSEVLKGQLEKKESLDLVIKTVREVLGKEYSFACVLSTGKGNSIPSDVDRDGMVATALRDLGGEIVDIQ